MTWDIIIDPNTKISHKISDKNGQQLLQKYLFQLGGETKSLPNTDILSIGIVGGGPAGMISALLLSKYNWCPVKITIYEKRQKRTRPQTLFIDITNILSGHHGTSSYGQNFKKIILAWFNYLFMRMEDVFK